MDAGTLEFRLLAVTIFYSSVLTSTISPVFIYLYRRRVSQLMRQTTVDDRTSLSSDALSDVSMSEQILKARPSLAIVSLLNEDKSGASRQDISTLVQRKLWMIAIAYVLAAFGHAAICTLFFSFAHFPLTSLSIVCVAFIIFTLPAIPTALHILVSSKLKQLIVLCIVLALCYVALGRLRGMGLALFQLHLLIPIILLVIFSLRFWHGVAPFTLLIAILGSFAWMIGLEVARFIDAESSLLRWIFRITGGVIGVALGYLTLLRVSRLHKQKHVGDQELFIDTWWLLYTTITAMLLVRGRSLIFAAVLLAFPFFLLVKRYFLRRMPITAQSRPPRLLLLRVFGHTSRTERLFESLTLRWRCLGVVQLIAGTDLARRNIEPLYFASFLAGKLNKLFVSSRADLQKQLTELDDTTDPEKRFPIHQFYCTQDTWMAAMQALTDRSDIVLMDVRSFSANNAGCRFELQYLAQHHPNKRVFLLVDKTTDQDLLIQEIVGQREITVGKEEGASWVMINAKKYRDRSISLFRLLSASLPRSSPA